jgi:hypothetical protein
MKVNFLIVGAQKSGTTALDWYLRNHPQVEMANIKEVHFFDNEAHFINEVDYSKYHTAFENRFYNTIKGEATPIYMYWNAAPERIWKYNPNMKLIAILRNPIERAFSHWNMQRDRGYDVLSFSDAIRKETERCREVLPLQHRLYSYVDRGFYTEQLRRLWHYFPKDQTLILKHESLKFDLSNTLSKISAFLHIEEFKSVKYEDTHSRQYVSQMTEADRSCLCNLFYSEIKHLESILGWDCNDWLT